MATRQSTTTVRSNRNAAAWSGWIAALFGLWVAASSFVLTGPIDGGGALYSTVASGAVVAVLAGYAAWTHRDLGNTGPQWSGWLAALLGLWILVSPFVLTGSIGFGTPIYSHVIAGIAVLVLAGNAGYEAGVT